MNKIFLAIWLSFSTMSYLYSQDQNEANQCSSKQELIYIQQAKGAKLSVCPDKIGYYLLSVTGNDKTLVYFSDRPDRVAGTLTLAQFVKKWEASTTIKDELPNAVISYVNFKSENEDGVGADILQLSDPKYDSLTDTVTFLAKPLHEYEVMTGYFENIVIVYDGVDYEN